MIRKHLNSLQNPSTAQDSDGLNLECQGETSQGSWDSSWYRAKSYQPLSMRHARSVHHSLSLHITDNLYFRDNDRKIDLYENEIDDGRGSYYVNLQGPVFNGGSQHYHYRYHNFWAFARRLPSQITVEYSQRHQPQRQRRMDLVSQVQMCIIDDTLSR